MKKPKLNLIGRKGNYDHMRSDVKRDMQWSDKFIPEAFDTMLNQFESWRPIWASQLADAAYDYGMTVPLPSTVNLCVSSWEQDIQSIDAFIKGEVTIEPFINIGYRVLRDTGERKVTIRTARISGVDTEYHKLPSGILQLYFFGWAFKNSDVLSDCLIYDPQTFCKLKLHEVAKKRERPSNDGGLTHFGPLNPDEYLPCVVWSTFKWTETVALF